MPEHSWVCRKFNKGYPGSAAYLGWPPGKRYKRVPWCFVKASQDFRRERRIKMCCFLIYASMTMKLRIRSHKGFVKALKWFVNLHKDPLDDLQGFGSLTQIYKCFLKTSQSFIMSSRPYRCFTELHKTSLFIVFSQAFCRRALNKTSIGLIKHHKALCSS